MNSVQQNLTFDKSLRQYEISTSYCHVNKLICGKTLGIVGKSKATDTLMAGRATDFVERPLDSKYCCLPDGHDGKCAGNLAEFCAANPLQKKAHQKIMTMNFQTPGNDYAPNKNRGCRNFQNALTPSQAKEIRHFGKTSCAIPLSEYSPGLFQAHSFLDWMVYLSSTENFKYNTTCSNFESILFMLEQHKSYIRAHFDRLNRPVFDTEGFTICAVVGNRVEMEDWNVSPCSSKSKSIQFGHVRARSPDYCSVLSLGAVAMSRRGNLILGVHDFLGDEWVIELKNISSRFL